MGQFALLIPAVIKHPDKLVSPFLRSMMWRMDAGSAEIIEPGFVRASRTDISSPRDGFIRHVSREMITRLRGLRLRNLGCIAVDCRIVLMRFALIEAIEIVESQTSGPSIERTSRTNVRLWRVVPLAEHRGCVTIVTQSL